MLSFEHLKHIFSWIVIIYKPELPWKVIPTGLQSRYKISDTCRLYCTDEQNYIIFKVPLEGNFVCLEYQSLKDYFSKTTKWKLNILVSMCFWKIALYCKLNFIFQNQLNQKLCIIMHNKLGYALWLKIACPGQITHQKFLFPLHDLTTAYKTVSQDFDIWFHSFVMS
jgi:hypothetical protein